MFGSKGFGTTGTFGASPAFGNTFGQTTQQSGTSLFGAKPTVSFGAASTAQPTGTLFGSPANTAFGATTGSSLFGGTSTFSTPSAGTLFGSPAQQSKPLFGATTTTPFGAAATTAGTGFSFGTSGTTASLFGQQPQQTAASTGLFGAQPTGTTGGGLFGSSMVAPTGTTVKFNPKIDTDTMLKNNMQQNIQTKHQCITAMKEYELKALEELRVEDYLANRKGPSAATQSGFTFGSTLGQQQQQQQQNTGLFGTATTTTGSIFGANKSLFGTTSAFNTTTTTTTGTSLFGQPAQQQSTGLFGTTAVKPLFGAATTASTFNFSTPASTGGIFGQTQPQQTTNLFGATNAAQPSLFGANTQQQPAGLFGTQNTGLFGQQQQQQPAQSVFGTTTTGFGAPAATGFGTFGQPQQNPFGATTNIFGAKPAATTAPAFGGFGTTNTFGNFGGFGASTQPSIFGANQQAQQQKLLFSGFGQQQPAFGTGTGTTAGGLFGNTFGGTQSMFGGQQQQKPGLAFGAPTGGFGMATTGFGTAGFGGTMDPSQMATIGMDHNTALAMHEVIKTQLHGLSTSPYGDRNISKERKGELIPTDPLAQKRLLDSAKSSFGTGSGIQAKPLPPFKPASRLMFTSQDVRKQQDVSSGFQGVDSDTISFTEGFLPKKNIRKLVLKPKGNDGLNSSISTGTMSEGQRSTTFPENRTLTTAICPTSEIGMDRGPVRALSFDNSMTSTEDDSHPCSASSRNTHDFDKSEEQRRREMPTIPETPISSPQQQQRNQPATTSTSSGGQSSPSMVSHSVQAPSSDENLPKEPHVAGIILVRPDYYTVPSMKELEAMTNLKTGACVVNGFTVGRTGYGSVFWSGPTNVAMLNLDQLVVFRHKEVVVYPDEGERPPVGHELNKKAEITLERVWPIDKASRLPIKDPERLEKMRYREKLEKATAEMDAEFIDYRPDSGAWVFQVAHFSKYGLADEADDEAPSMMEFETSQQEQTTQAKVQRLKPTKIQKDVLPSHRSVVDVGFSLDIDSRGLGGISREDTYMEDTELLTDLDYADTGSEELMAACAGIDVPYRKKTLADGLFKDFFREIRRSRKTQSPGYGSVASYDEFQDADLGRFSPRVQRKPLLDELHEKSLILLLDRAESETSMIELTADSELEPSPVSVLVDHRPAAISVIPPRHTIRLVPYESSIAYKLSQRWLDAGLFNGRRFRVGWAPLGVMTAISVHQEDGDGTRVGSIFGGAPTMGPQEFCVTLIPAVSESRLMPLVDLDKLLECQFALSEFSGSVCGQITPITDGSKTLEKYKETASALNDSQIVASVVQLCESLWGDLDAGETREDLLSSWIMEESRDVVDATVESLKRKGPQYFAEAIFCLVTSKRVDEAVQLAQQSGDWRLSLLIGQMLQSGPVAKALMLKQLSQWFEVEADKYMDSARLKIYMLAAGVMKWKTSDGRMICAYSGLDWKRTLGIYLWYAPGQRPTILNAMEAYDVIWRGYDPNSEFDQAVPPMASYLERNNESYGNLQPASVQLDGCYHLLRLFADKSYSVYKVLEPAAWTSDPFDFHLSWHVWCILRSFGLVVVDPGRLDTVHAQYAFQLERRGVWQRGIFVALHTDDAKRREALIKQLLAQHGRDGGDEDARLIIVEEFGIPKEWFRNA